MKYPQKKTRRDARRNDIYRKKHNSQKPEIRKKNVGKAADKGSRDSHEHRSPDFSDKIFPQDIIKNKRQTEADNDVNKSCCNKIDRHASPLLAAKTE
jgi:hypothetical protein